MHPLLNPRLTTRRPSVNAMRQALLPRLRARLQPRLRPILLPVLLPVLLACALRATTPAHATGLTEKAEMAEMASTTVTADSARAASAPPSSGLHASHHTSKHTGKQNSKQSSKHTGKHTSKHNSSHTGQHTRASSAKVRSSLAISVAAAEDGSFWMVGLDAQGRLALQRSLDQGRSWDAPRLLDIGEDGVAADGESRPKILLGRGDMMLVSYSSPLARPYTAQVRLLRSTDRGRSFAAPLTVHADRQVITHRFESLAFDAQGRLHAVWIDKRDLEASRAAPAGDAPPYRGAALYRNVSLDGGLSFGPDTRVADHSCECCRIALAPTAEGGVAAMWRHVFAPNERDHAFARLGQDLPAGAEPVRATQDHWALDGCPHHGPGLSRDAAQGYHAVWFGERGGVAGVRYGRLDEDGHPMGKARLLPDEAAEHADVLSSGPHVAISWRSFDGQRSHWRAWISADGGGHFTLRELAQTAGDNDHPKLFLSGQAIYGHWRSVEGVRIERLTP